MLGLIVLHNDALIIVQPTDISVSSVTIQVFFASSITPGGSQQGALRVTPGFYESHIRSFLHIHQYSFGENFMQFKLCKCRIALHVVSCTNWDFVRTDFKLRILKLGLPISCELHKCKSDRRSNVVTNLAQLVGISTQ